MIVSAALSLFAALCVAVVFDWLFVTRLGADFSDFDYRYWPFSGVRWLGLGALTSAAIYMWAITGTNESLWALVPFAVLLMAYIATAIVDLGNQRRTGDRTPPRYSDDDY